MSYGAKIVAPNGSSFIIPDSNPFVFYRKNHYQFVGNAASNAAWDTGIPVSTVAIICARFRQDDFYGVGLGGVQSGPNQNTGTWWVWASAYEQKTYDIDVYIFVDRELNPPDTVYGVAIYDAQGRMALHTNSKPLKLYEYPIAATTRYPINLGIPVAAPCTMLSIQKQGGLIGDLDYTYAICMATSISASLGWEGYIGQPNFTGFAINSFYYIDCREYD